MGRTHVWLSMVCGLVVAVASAAEWRTDGGLSIMLADRTGQCERVTVSGRPVPLASDPGGLSYRELTRDPDAAARTILQIDAEGREQPWTQALFADWKADGDYVRRQTGGAHGGEGYLGVGNGKDAGAGMAAAGSMTVPPGGECTISWWGRTRKTDLRYILCMRVFDAQGRDITANVPAPPGWGWSPYSNAHYRVDAPHAAAGTWEQIAFDYMVNEEVAAAQLSLRVYSGEDPRVDVDDLQVAVKSAQWSGETPVSGRVERTPEGLRQRAAVASAGLTFAALYTQEAGHLRAVVEVLQTGGQPRERCLRIRYRLPVALKGWTWSSDPTVSETIAGNSRHGNGFGLAGHQVSRYPVASVSRGPVGLAMGVPLDQPALQTFGAAADGMTTVVDLALSLHAPRARGRFTFCLYRHDPAWTFRAALERYYALFPDLFARATSRGGAWTLRLPEHARPQDYGLAFYESGPLPPDKQEYCRARNILMFPYAEPWGRRTNLGEATSRADLPPYDKRLEFLKELAATKEEGKLWGRAPMGLMGQAVLNSLVLGPDGQAVHLVDFYSSWSQWWQLNTDPDLPEPNMAVVCRKYEIDPLLEWADGIYLDSVSPYFCQWEDHDPAHLAAADRPLAFSLRTATPIVLSGFSHYEFISQLHADLQRQGKLVMMNLYPPAGRLYGHMGDVVGSELLDLQEDQEAMQQRVYAYQRPVSNLMQWKSAVQVRVPAMTPEEMEAFFANQLLYGFWPGISTAGGGTEPGYAHMHRYFEDPALLARDRDLFARYLPVFDALNRAGWQPVPHVRAGAPEVRVERYGDGAQVMLAVANTTAEPKETTITLERDWWEQALEMKGPLTFRSALTADTFRAETAGKKLTCTLTVPGHRTLVLRPAGQ